MFLHQGFCQCSSINNRASLLSKWQLFFLIINEQLSESHAWQQHSSTPLSCQTTKIPRLQTNTRSNCYPLVLMSSTLLSATHCYLVTVFLWQTVLNRVDAHIWFRNPTREQFLPLSYHQSIVRDPLTPLKLAELNLTWDDLSLFQVSSLEIYPRTLNTYQISIFPWSQKMALKPKAVTSAYICLLA